MSPCPCKDKASFLSLEDWAVRASLIASPYGEELSQTKQGPKCLGSLLDWENGTFPPDSLRYEEMRSLHVPGACLGASSHQHRKMGKHFPLPKFHTVNPAAPFLHQEHPYRWIQLQSFFYFYYPSTTEFKSKMQNFSFSKDPKYAFLILPTK